MNVLLQQHGNEIEALCRRFHVRRLDLFGSAAAGQRRTDSDFDLLVEFGPIPERGYADAYFGLREGLESAARRAGGPGGRIDEHCRIIAFRNILIHGDAEADDRLVWDIVETRLPRLREQVDALLEQAP